MHCEIYHLERQTEYLQLASLEASLAAGTHEDYCDEHWQKYAIKRMD